MSLYRRLPAGARSIGATLYGLRLRWWRYGGDSEKLAAAALERDHWSAAQWTAWREERLAAILHRAATRVPFYRDQWAARRRAGDTASIDLLANWPVLEKETVRATPEAFVADDCNPRRMLHEQTSGTTGKPLHIWLSDVSVKLTGSDSWVNAK